MRQFFLLTLAVFISTISLTLASGSHNSLDKWYLKDCTNTTWLAFEKKEIADVYTNCGSLPTNVNYNIKILSLYSTHIICHHVGCRCWFSNTYCAILWVF